ncbi:hypothetical protein [Cellulomonas sp. KH9]|uniref:hypothetical protein n=1 Tax=Cellulomonas sp. KH9 TaxID=1855324 RepID=UPI0008DEFDD1|nr:hypothetical protein [Cellulomonas sp. KH9]SFJ68386.1 hypothetical protein SAMN05216467_0484 [Cellulomonas sp. KH9]
MNPSTTPQPRRRRMVAIGVIAATLTVAGSGAAIAANPNSVAGQAVEEALGLVGVDWSGMPEGYTREQYVAFWGAGYTVADLEELSALWGTESTETKARAGQMLLDGEQVPVDPTGTVPTAPAEAESSDAAAPAPADVPVRPEGGDVPAPEQPTVAYTDAQYDAFWDAGYTSEDAKALAALWGTEIIETKARAGQALLDGQTLPVAPGSTVTGS